MENNCIYCLFDALVLDLIASNYTDARRYFQDLSNCKVLHQRYPKPDLALILH